MRKGSADSTELDRGAPVVIGGGGGSGTRVIASILLRLGYWMGRDRNAAEDNLLFTLLLKRPEWFARADARSVDRALAAMERGILSRCSLHDAGVIGGAAWDMLVRNRDYPFVRRIAWTMRRIASASTTAPVSGAAGWGWKEPNTHLYLEHLARRFPRMRYIHVIRHGLDMAYSTNQAQMRNWGSRYGVDAEREMSPAAALKFWVSSNSDAIERAGRLFQERFLLVRFDDLCDAPAREIERLMEFMGASAPPEQMRELVALPRSPASRGRYRERDLSEFDEEAIEAVEALGFSVERAAHEVAA